MGMIMASNMSQKMGMLSSEDTKRIKNLIESMNLPVSSPDLDKNDFFESMKRDKKAQDGEISLILLDCIGSAKITSDYPKEVLMKTISEY